MTVSPATPLPRQRREDWRLPADALALAPHFAAGLPDDRLTVTVGIPNYKRMDRLRLCLASLAQQQGRPFKVIVSNDDPSEPVPQALIDAFADAFAAFEVYEQPANLGLLGNAHFVLAKARTPYFMWLANDDAVSENWIEDLATLLDADATAAGAMGQWILALSPTHAFLRPQIRHDGRARLPRVMNFIWRADDAFFYGVFRREALLRGTFQGYVWPNKGFVRNWCYVFLIAPLCAGRMVYSDRCRWFCDEYSAKHYPAAPSVGGKITVLVAAALRRVNVHALYARNLAARAPLLVVPGLAVSLAALAREACVFLGGYVFRRVRRLTPL